MTNYEFVMKHRQAFNVYCQASGVCANPHATALVAKFRAAVEKQLNAIRKSRPACVKPASYALIGKSTVTTPSSVPTVPATANTFAIRDTAKPRKPAGLVFDNANGIFL
ncbi:MAG: hypothetical protein ACRC6V_05690 [Bacteroidales bacterium]